MKASLILKKMRDERKSEIEHSNIRIAAALEVLRGHERGQAALADFKKLITGPASGLDFQSMLALTVLLTEYAAGRRTFLAEISLVPSENKK